MEIIIFNSVQMCNSLSGHGKTELAVSSWAISVSLCSRVQRAETFIPFNHNLPVKKILYIEKPTIYLLKLAASKTTWCPLLWQTGRVLIKEWCFAQGSIYWSVSAQTLFSYIWSRGLHSFLVCGSFWSCNSQEVLQRLCSVGFDSSGCFFIIQLSSF